MHEASRLDDALAARIEFLLELDKLKTVLRRSRLVDGSRLENTAEHSWHLAMFAVVLAPHAPAGAEIDRAIEMLLVHDIVEIDAGDTYIYDESGAVDKEERENAAAKRLFGLLPASEGARLEQLWREYEARESPTARFAYGIDRLQPSMLNVASGGVSWAEHGIRHSQPVAITEPIAETSPLLWQLARTLFDLAADEGLLIDDRGDTP